ACAAVIATLNTLRKDEPYQRVEEHGRTLMDGIRRLGEDNGVPLHVQGLPAAFHVSFGSPDGGAIRNHADLASLDTDRYARFAHTLVDHGIWAAPRGIWYVSAAHGNAEVSETFQRLGAALAAETAGG